MQRSRCTEGFLKYEFDVEGHTVAKCKEGRKTCPHYGGKCPALTGGDT